MEFVLKHGKPERTEAMKAGLDRHAQLEHHEVRPTFLVLPSRMLLRLHGFYLGMLPINGENFLFDTDKIDASLFNTENF